MAWEPVYAGERAFRETGEWLPASTEQILHPQRYPDDRPIPVSLPALTTTLGPGWRIVADDVMGPGEDPRPEELDDRVGEVGRERR